MRIVVLVKHVPDALAAPALTGDHRVDRTGPGLLSELDEYPLEVARSLVAEHGGEAIALAMGPADAETAVRRALALGADRGVLVTDDSLTGSDAIATARVLAGAVTALGGVDLVLAGDASPDGATGLIPTLVAALLGLPALTGLVHLTVDDAVATGRRPDERAIETLTAGLPALASVTDRGPAPRYPTFMQVRAARTKPIELWDLSATGVPAAAVGTAGARTQVLDSAPLPRRPPGERIVDDGTAGERLVAFLARHQIV